VRVHQPEVTSISKQALALATSQGRQEPPLDLTSGEAKLRGRTVGMESA
jgi:hypothetical protein